MGDPTAALKAADQAIIADCDNITARRIAGGAAIELGLVDRAAEENDRILRVPNAHSTDQALALRHLINSGRIANAQGHLLRIAREGCRDPLVLMYVRQLPADDELRRLAVDAARAVPLDAKPARRRQAAQILHHFGEHVPAHLDAQADFVPPDLPPTRPLADLDRNGAVKIASARHSRGTVLVFTGLAAKASLSLPVFDRYMAGLEVSTIYLTDIGRWLFMRGISELAAGYDETLEALREQIARLGAGPVTTIGTSAGGYAAMRYGVDLGAAATLCFSPPSNLTAEFLAEDRRGQLVAKRLQALDAEMLDLRPHLLSREAVNPIDIFYGAGMPQDRRHAEHLRGVPGVTLHPLDTIDIHGTMKTMAAAGTLAATLERHVARRTSELPEPEPADRQFVGSAIHGA